MYLRDSQMMSGPDDEQPGPSRRKRGPSMSETMPLYMLCKEDLDSMDKEVSTASTYGTTLASTHFLGFSIFHWEKVGTWYFLGTISAMVPNEWRQY